MPLMRPKCPVCGEKAEWFRTTKNKPYRIYCAACRKSYDHANAPRIFLFDIETSRIKANLFRAGKQVVSRDWIDKDFYILSWAGKWLFEKETFGDAVTPKEARARDDKRIVKRLHNFVKTADFFITYNGDKFDFKKIDWRFLIHNLPPTRYNSIDLYQKMKERFKGGPVSLAMDYVCKELGYNGKHHTDALLWDEVEAGDKDAIDRMYEYNVNDVWMMEDLYPRVRGWFKTHPNFSAFLDYYQVVDKSLQLKEGDYRCPRCIRGIIHESKFKMKYQTPAGYFYGVASCPHCGAWIRLTQRDRQKIWLR